MTHESPLAGQGILVKPPAFACADCLAILFQASDAFCSPSLIVYAKAFGGEGR